MNMRVRLQNDHSGETFSDQLLAIGNGMFPVDSISGRTQLPPEFCNLVTSKNYLVENVFPNILTNYKNHKWPCKRAILAAKNKDVHEINNIILTMIRDQAVIYKSVDTVLESNEAVNYPSEFLNSLDLPGFPPRVLQLKLGLPIIVLRNTDLPFQFKRSQFPIQLAFAITINKSQGQSLEKCGIDINTDCFLPWTTTCCMF